MLILINVYYFYKPFKNKINTLINNRIVKFSKGSYFITGIDTDIGKSYAVAFLAQSAITAGFSVITQKFIQTGCDPKDVAEDIITHRKLMGVELFPEDIDHTTCPIIFRLPSSPHLAAREEGSTVDIELISESTKKLESKYDVVLIEGAGGVMVPIEGDYLTIDYITSTKLPTILVTSARLGSLNHTLLTLEQMRQRGVNLSGVVYNMYGADCETITQDSADYIKRYLEKYFTEAWFSVMEIKD